MTNKEAIKYLQQLYPYGGHCWLDEQRIEAIGMAIKALQEEPVSERFAFKAIPRLLEMIEPTDRAKVYTAKLADTLEIEGYSTDAKIVRESLKIMNGEKVPMATMDEEFVSKELEEAANKYGKEQYGRKISLLLDRCRGCYAPIVTAFKAGAKWQEKQDQETIEPAEDHAMLAGMEKMKQQMMAKAVDGKIYETQARSKLKAVTTGNISRLDYKVGDKVKVIVIKED